MIGRERNKKSASPTITHIITSHIHRNCWIRIYGHHTSCGWNKKANIANHRTSLSSIFFLFFTLQFISRAGQQQLIVNIYAQSTYLLCVKKTFIFSQRVRELRSWSVLVGGTTLRITTTTTTTIIIATALQQRQCEWTCQCVCIK